MKTAKRDDILKGIYAVAGSIGGMIPEFIADEDVIDVLVDQINTLRSEIIATHSRDEFLEILDGFIAGLKRDANPL